MAVTTYYKWNKYTVEEYYTEESGAFGDWSDWSAGTSYSGYRNYSFDSSSGTFSLSSWFEGQDGTYYNGSGSSITETNVKWKYIAGTEEVYYRTQDRSISASSPSYYQGDFIEMLQSTNSSAYPYNGEYLAFWYVYIGSYTVTDSSYFYIKTNCTNGNNGTITASASGGSGTHIFMLMKGSTTVSNWSTKNSFTGLSAGTYTLYGKDVQATNTEYTVTISIAAAATFTATKTNCSAYGVNDGTISAYGTGGSGSYQYKLSLGTTVVADWSSTAQFTGLSAGTYTLKCRDAAYTSVETTIFVIVYSPAGFSYTKTDNTGSSSPNGTITAAGAGGSGSYLFRLNSGDFQSSGEFTGLSANTYTLLCVEQGGLSTQQSFTVEIALDEVSNLFIGNNRYRMFIGNTEYAVYLGNNRII